MESKIKIYTKKTVNILLDICIFLFGIILLISIYKGIQVKIFDKDYADFFGYTTFEVQTGSMSSAINPGDWVIVELTNNVKLNDIITYRENDEFVTHRIVEEYKGVYVTRGDANNAKDEPISKEQVVGRVTKVLSSFGIFRKTLFSPSGLLTIIIILYLINLIFKSKDKSSSKENSNFIDKIRLKITKIVDTIKDSKFKSKKNIMDKNDILDTRKDQEEKITLEKVKEIYGQVPEEELEKTSLYRVIPVDLSELDDTLLEIAKNELKESQKNESKMVRLNKENVVVEKEEIPSDKTNMINLALLKEKAKNKKSKNAIDKAMFIKVEELKEIINILHKDEKVLVNEATIRDIFITTYIEAKYYNYYDDKSIEYRGKNLAIKIERVSKELAKELIKDYDGSDIKYKDKVAKYVGIFVLIANLEQAFVSIEDVKAKNEFYKKEILKFADEKNWNSLKIKSTIEEIIKIQRKYVGILEFFLKKMDTNIFKLQINPLVSNKKMFGLELQHNISFSKVYSDYIIDKTYSEGIIAEDKIIVLINLLLVQIIKDISLADFDKKYVLYIPNTLYTKETKFIKVLGLLDNEYVKNNVIILIDIDNLLKRKVLIKKIRKMGYRFALVINKEILLSATDKKNLCLVDSIFINKKIINITQILSSIPEDMLSDIIYEDIVDKVGDFGSE